MCVDVLLCYWYIKIGGQNQVRQIHLTIFWWKLNGNFLSNKNRTATTAGLLIAVGLLIATTVGLLIAYWCNKFISIVNQPRDYVGFLGWQGDGMTIFLVSPKKGRIPGTSKRPWNDENMKVNHEINREQPKCLHKPLISLFKYQSGR